MADLLGLIPLLRMEWWWVRITAQLLFALSLAREKVESGSGLKLCGPRKRNVEGLWKLAGTATVLAMRSLIWQEKINVCRSKLSSWSKNKFNASAKKINALMDQLGTLQLNWGPNKEKILKSDY